MSLVKVSRDAGSGKITRSPLQESIARAASATMNRRSFLMRAGVTAGAGVLARHLPLNVIGPAHAADPKPATGPVEVKHTVCTHCSVGCSVEAVVQNGVWIRQDTAFDSPLNMGAH